MILLAQRTYQLYPSHRNQQQEYHSLQKRNLEHRK